jgi:hypothetical protein
MYVSLFRTMSKYHVLEVCEDSKHVYFECSIILFWVGIFVMSVYSSQDKRKKIGLGLSACGEIYMIQGWFYIKKILLFNLFANLTKIQSILHQIFTTTMFTSFSINIGFYFIFLLSLYESTLFFTTTIFLCTCETII